MILVIEIGGTKLQVGLFDPKSVSLTECVRSRVVAADGAVGILKQIESTLPGLLEGRSVSRCGIGFGGPVHVDGTIFKSHQIQGWDGFNLSEWTQQKTGLPTSVANDCDAAALAEAHYGAGRGASSMFYVTVGTGVGGGWVCNGLRQGADRPAVAEIGHLRPGMMCTDEHHTVESYASGRGMTQQVHRMAREICCWLEQGRISFDLLTDLTHLPLSTPSSQELQDSWNWYRTFDSTELDTEQVAQAAEDQIWLAQVALQLATTTLGWALAQMVTLLAPERVVLGGGVCKINQKLFWDPLRDHFSKYTFAPLRDSNLLIPAALGDDVVLYGAAAIASASDL